MHKKNSNKLASSVLSIFLLGTLLFTSTVFSSFNNTSSSQQVFAQLTSHYEYETNNYSYDDYYDNNYVPNSYIKYPTDKNKYECQKDTFEGFFVSSVIFCKFNQFHKDDSKRDNNITGTQGPQGIPGPAGVTNFNATNTYLVTQSAFNNIYLW